MKRITTLIPAYKVEYLGELFTALCYQTYKNFRVIVSDDSPNGRVSELLLSEPFRPVMQRIEVSIVQGPREGSIQNAVHLLRLASNTSELVHILCDDDIIYPRFYETHAMLYENPSIDCSVSKRWTATETGLPIGTLPTPPYIEQQMNRALILDAPRLFKSTLPKCTNWLGETSNSIFSAELIPMFIDQTMDGISYWGLGDIGFFLKASLTKNVAFIQDYLSFFRINPQQQTGKTATPIIKSAYFANCALSIIGHKANYLSADDMVSTFDTVSAWVSNLYNEDVDMQNFITLSSEYRLHPDSLMTTFQNFWSGFLKSIQPVGAVT